MEIFNVSTPNCVSEQADVNRPAPHVFNLPQAQNLRPEAELPDSRYFRNVADKTRIVQPIDIEVSITSVVESPAPNRLDR